MANKKSSFEGDTSIVEEIGVILEAKYKREEKLHEDIYDIDEFLKDVYINEDEFIKIDYLINHNKNILIQGPSAVGKTYFADRLVDLIDGEYDGDNVKYVQFHKSYSYEDFMSPKRLKGYEDRYRGDFYDICQKAKNDLDTKYFIIIDEISRGNVGEIFGEITSIIDKRERKIELTNNKEMFYIPKNLYIIGIINTLDDGYDNFDFVIKNKFAKYNLRPAFDTIGFRKSMIESGTEEDVADFVIRKLDAVNQELEKELGEKYLIGHGYFMWKRINELSYKNIIEQNIKGIFERYFKDDKFKQDYYIQKLLKS